MPLWARVLALSLCVLVTSQETLAVHALSARKTHLAPPSAYQGDGGSGAHLPDAPIRLVDVLEDSDAWDGAEKREILLVIMQKLLDGWRNARRAELGNLIAMGVVDQSEKALEKALGELILFPRSIEWDDGLVTMRLYMPARRIEQQVEVTGPEGGFSIESLVSQLARAGPEAFRYRSLGHRTVEVPGSISLPVFDLPTLGEYEPNVTVGEYPDSISFKAATIVAERIRENSLRGRPTVLGLGTGRGMVWFYSELARLLRETDADLSGMRIFLLEELEGLAGEDSRSARGFLQKHFLSNLKPKAIAAAYIHSINSLGPDGLPKESRELLRHLGEFEEAIRAVGGLDIAVASLQANGGLLLHEPGTPLSHRAHRSVLGEGTRKEISVSFDDQTDEVPLAGFSVGMGTLLEARKVLVLGVDRVVRGAALRMIEGEISADVPASALRRRSNVLVFLDSKAAVGIQRYERWGKVAVGPLRRGFFHMLLWLQRVVQYSSYIILVGVTGAGTYSAVYFLGTTGLVAASLFTALLVLRNFQIYWSNPFRGLDAGETQEEKGVLYGVTTDHAGNTWHFARPASRVKVRTPLFVFHHGREPFELIVGFMQWVRHVLSIFAKYPYDVRHYWGRLKGKDNILRRIATGDLLEPGQTADDVPTVVSAPLNDIGVWPFSNLTKFRSLEQGPVTQGFEAIRDGSLIPLPTETVPVEGAISVGARALYFRTVYKHIEMGGDPPRWRLADRGRRSKAMLLVAPFFSLGKKSNRWMRWQRAIFWRPLARFYAGVMGLDPETMLAYDEMDRSFDMTKLHDRARLAAQHLDWPQVVMISTMMDGPGLEPPPWHSYRSRVREARGSAAKTAAGLANARDLLSLWFRKLGHIVEQKILNPSGRRLGLPSAPLSDAPWYYWLASFFAEVRDDDGVVDAQLAVGLDQHGRVVDPKTLPLVVHHVWHDALQIPMVQRLFFQLAVLQNNDVDLREEVTLVAKGRDGRVQRMRLADHGPTNPVHLYPEDEVTLYVTRSVEDAPRFISDTWNILYRPLVEAMPAKPVWSQWHARAESQWQSLSIMEKIKTAMTREAAFASTDWIQEPPMAPRALGAEEELVLRHALAEATLPGLVAAEVWLQDTQLHQEGLESAIAIGAEAVSGAELLGQLRDLAAKRSGNTWAASEPRPMHLVQHMAIERELAPNLPRLADHLLLRGELLRVIRLLEEVHMPRLWSDLAEDKQEWMRGRMEDLEGWLNISASRKRYFSHFLGIRDRPELDKTWRHFRKGKASSDALFAALIKHAGGAFLQFLVMMDIRFDLRPPKRMRAPQPLAEPAVELAA